MYNSLTQSPCDVAYELASVCVNGREWFLVQLIILVLNSLANAAESNPQPLLPDYAYIGPTPAYANLCLCSSVYYSLKSACGYCQGRQFIR
jgi:hypothetical protein